jgi:Zn-dependent protease
MDFTPRGSFRLFQAFGIDVYLHWTWFAVAFLMIGDRRHLEYAVPAWKVVEYVSMFAIVLLHEFGHALACRSVGGVAQQIVLWPLGGVAYVAPPARPGAFLWSIAAGPLVNVALVAPTVGLWLVGARLGWKEAWPDLFTYLQILTVLNLVLLVFNLIPVYPLDGGQILFALLWYGLGRWHSLALVSLVGMVFGGAAAAGCVALMLLFGRFEGVAGLGLMLGLIAAFVALRSYVSFRVARAALDLEALPRNGTAACPSCGAAPPRGPFWVCDECQTRFDVFDRKGHCPGCGAWHLDQPCPFCQQTSHVDLWLDRSRDQTGVADEPAS